MFRSPQLHEYLAHHGLVENIYKTLSNPDMSEPVITVLDILTKTNNLPPMTKEEKSESKSTFHRNEGNQAYARSKFQMALVGYNRALLHAPMNSRAMKLAYSNRSALLYKMKAFSECLNDIETCFTLGCPIDIIEKLKKRREEARSCLWMEKLDKEARYTAFSEEYFQFNVKRNLQIPCASTDVGVIIESHVPRIVAATDIKVGTVVAVETAFVSMLDNHNGLFSCYYCHKMDMNLHPCHGCCFALFCNEECRTNCMIEYHNIECKILEAIEVVSSGTMSRLAIKALLKMKLMSKSWKELESASYNMGLTRMMNSPINHIYDMNHEFSLLCVTNEQHFLTGPLYNASFICAAIISYLENISSFFPHSPNERNAAIRAVARLLMYLSLYSVHSQILLCCEVTIHERTKLHDLVNYGWFSFIGKLKNSCNPNCLAVGLNKKMGLVTSQPIKRGTELTISYVGHWLINTFDCAVDKQLRQKNMFSLYGVVCNCLICTHDYKLHNNYQLTEMQKKNFRKLNLEEMKERFNSRNVPDIYLKLCKTLAFLNDLPYSEEYKQVYRLFRQCLMYLQDSATLNVILDNE